MRLSSPCRGQPLRKLRALVPAGEQLQVVSEFTLSKHAESQRDARAKGKVTLVFFIGGVTFGEVAALRFIDRMEEGQREYIVASTKLMNGDSLLESVVERIPNALFQEVGASARKK